jgi:hypothetical protein
MIASITDKRGQSMSFIPNKTLCRTLSMPMAASSAARQQKPTSSNRLAIALKSR